MNHTPNRTHRPLRTIVCAGCGHPFTTGVHGVRTFCSIICERRTRKARQAAANRA